MTNMTETDSDITRDDRDEIGIIKGDESRSGRDEGIMKRDERIKKRDRREREGIGV